MDPAPATPPASHVTIEHLPEGLVVTMPLPRSGCTIASLSAWLIAWVAGEVGGGAFLVATLSPPSLATLFALVWLAVWTGAGISALSVLALTVAGKEIITLSPDGLRRRAEAFGIGRTVSYEPREVEDLRVADDSSGQPAFIAFDYRGTTVRMGSRLVGDDAKRIVEALYEAGSVDTRSEPTA